jgi:hypothetical protein
MQSADSARPKGVVQERFFPPKIVNGDFDIFFEHSC